MVNEVRIDRRLECVVPEGVGWSFCSFVFVVVDFFFFFFQAEDGIRDISV